MNRIRTRHVRIILATDVLSRGIDLEKVDLVINYDDPYSAEVYFHRIGRTARFRKYGVSFLLMTEEKLSNFTGNKGYQFSITKITSEEELQVISATTNTRLEDKYRQLQAEGREKVYLGSDSMVQEWRDADIAHCNSAQFKYADVGALGDPDWEDNIDREIVEEDDGEKEAEKDDDIDYLPSFGSEEEEEEREDSEVKVVKQTLAERIVEKKRDFASRRNENEDGILGKREVIVNEISEDQLVQYEPMDYSKFRRLCDYLADPIVSAVAKTAASHCDIDMTFIKMLKEFETF